MQTYIVEQIDVQFTTLAISLSIAVLFSIIGFFLIRKFAKKAEDGLSLGFYAVTFGSVLLVAGMIVGVGVVGSAAMVDANKSKLGEVATSAGHTLSEEKLLELNREGFTTVSKDTVLAFSDEASGHVLTVFSSSENEKLQKEQEKKAAEKLKTLDY